jgi:hypothetical protein
VPLPDLSPFARQGTDETTELPAVSRGSEPKRRAPFTRLRRSGPSVGAGPSGDAGTPVDAKASESSGSGSGPSPVAVSHRQDRERRRPSTGALAGVGVAAVLGAGLLTTQVLTGDGGGTEGSGERALRHTPTDAPTDGAPPSPSPSRGKSASKSERPSASVPSRPSASGTPRAGRDGAGHTAPATPSRPPKSASARPDKTAGDQRPWHPHPGWPGHPSEGTLRPGDSGPEVAELQRRLKQAGFYDRGAEEDGVYSSEVQEGVFRYQARYNLFDDVPGDYGPVTRRHLEARTSG